MGFSPFGVSHRRFRLPVRMTDMFLSARALSVHFTLAGKVMVGNGKTGSGKCDGEKPWRKMGHDNVT
ncbi:hypothetical protein ABT56_18360 [Photobacterium aquae]|uniref:Uncharacterized protein n=1 Tax=Photobacterium aquae TaxID=1195763 RepID=A0A0J1JN33_9GAMM|nr:hypothetical protein [Photobacterium aquae]KLV03662.1 hypothetical protein ABT56_18360 [Photobacterium aquae]